jgi:hypothetical protein
MWNSTLNIHNIPFNIPSFKSTWKSSTLFATQKCPNEIEEKNV